MMQNVYLGNSLLQLFLPCFMYKTCWTDFIYFDSQQSPVTSFTFHFPYLCSPRWTGSAAVLANVVLHYPFLGGFLGFFEACKCQLAG